MHIFKLAAMENDAWFPGHACILTYQWGISSKVNLFRCLKERQSGFTLGLYYMIYIMVTLLQQQPWSYHKEREAIGNLFSAVIFGGHSYRGTQNGCLQQEVDDRRWSLAQVKDC